MGGWNRCNCLCIAVLVTTIPLFGQTTNSSVDTQQLLSSGTPTVVTFQDALSRARKNLPQFLSAKTDLELSRQDFAQARAALLPSLTYHAQFLYTEPTRTPTASVVAPATTPSIVFIANNTVHEYVSQGNAHEVVSLAGFQDVRRTRALQAAARAKLEIASRGLAVVVAQNFYGLLAAERKYATSQTAYAESQRFLKITQDLENGGEVAHSDAIKAEIQSNDRQRALEDSRLAMENARLGLAVIMFPSFEQNFTIVDDSNLSSSLPSLEETRALAAKGNPDMAAATATLAAADAEVWAVRGDHLPTLSFDYWYGIDSPYFAVHSPDHSRNLGYAAAATLDLPVWNWGATHSRVKQAELNRDRTRVELNFTQRQLAANLQSFYQEANTSRNQLDLLKRSFELAGDGLRLTTLRYQAGESTVLEVVDAQNTLTQAHDAFDDAQLRYRVAVAELQTLTGAF